MMRKKFFLIGFLLISFHYLAYSQCTARFGYQTDSVFKVHFIDSSNVDSSDNINSRIWFINDSLANTQKTFTYIFPDTGTYKVCLEIVTNGWCSDSICKNIRITEPDCYTSYTSQHIEGYTYSFMNMSSEDLSSWLWDFGDGQTSTDENTQHTYQNPGVYQVCLSSEDIYQMCSQQYCDTLRVLDTTPCIADFIYDDDNYNVQFTSTSSGPVDSYLWDFGDGNTSTEASPYHTYSSTGTYTVSLVVQGATSLIPIDTIAGEVQIDAYTYSRNPLYTIEGHIYAGNKIYTGDVNVVLIKKDSLNNYYNIDSVYTIDGLFLLKTGSGDYYIKAVPSDKKYMTTFYVDAVTIEDSYKLPVALNTGSIDIQLVERNELSNEEIERIPGVHIYPNPVHDKLYVEVSQTTHVKMFDLSGKVLINKEIEKNTIFNCSEIENGIYLILVNYKNGVYKKKLIIKHQ